MGKFNQRRCIIFCIIDESVRNVGPHVSQVSLIANDDVALAVKRTSGLVFDYDFTDGLADNPELSQRGTNFLFMMITSHYLSWKMKVG